jgi:hypothetical protein
MDLCGSNQREVGESKMTTTNCQWCDAMLENQLIYTVDTVRTEDGISPVTYIVGSNCCIGGPQRHNRYIQEYFDIWNTNPRMYFDFLPSVPNCQKLFNDAIYWHHNGASKTVVKDLFRTAWLTYKKLSLEDQARVVTH